MPTTRKKQIKTVSKDERSEGEAGDFSDSGSDWKISGASSSEDEDIDTHIDFEGEEDKSSGDDFRKAKKVQKDVNKPPIRRRKPQFAKDLINKINKQVTTEGDQDEIPAPQFSVKDLTEADKLLPSFLNLSESDSSDDDSQSQSKKKATTLSLIHEHYSDGDSDKDEYQDVWSSNIQDNSEDIAKKTFMELEKHKSEIEQTKASIENYVSKNQATQNISTGAGEFNVNDLLAQGEEVAENKNPPKNKMKVRKRRDDSDSEVEDWEEVNEAKSIPQQGLQLFVEFPNASKKSKKLDLEMMMKRKINRVKKEYQVYMHKVHVLCWLGHGNYVSRVLNDQEVMAAALAMVPKGCYPEERLTTKYVEQITTWYKDKLTLKQDKNEHKFRPKAPPLKTIILGQIKNRVTTAKKYNIFIFVAMLRALGLQCRVMFNFVTLPIRPPHSELCSLSIKPKDDSKNTADKSTENAGGKSAEKNKPKTTAKSKAKCTKKIAQVDGVYDTLSESDSEFESIIQLDGSNDPQPKVRNTRATRTKKAETNTEKDEDDGVSPPKRAKAKSNTDDIPNRKDKDKTSKSDNSEDKPSEAPKSLRKRAVRSKSATKTTDTKPLVKDIIIEDEDMADDSKDKLKAPHTTTLRRTARNKNETSKPENVSTKTEVLEKGNKTKKVTDNSKDKKHETTTLPSQRSVRNKDDLSKKSATNKRETSKSPQTKNNSQNSKLGETSIGQANETAISSVSSKILSPNLSKAKDTVNTNCIEMVSPRKTRSERRIAAKIDDKKPTKINADKIQPPAIIVTDENNVESNFFTDKMVLSTKRLNLSRKRSHTTVNAARKTNGENDMKPKTRTKSAPGTSIEKSKYFESEEITAKKPKLNNQNRQTKKEQIQENKLRVSHRDLRQKAKPKNDVTEDLVDIIKSRIKVEKAQSKKGKIKDESDEDSDFLPVEEVKSNNDSDEDFKPTKISPKHSKIIAKPGTSKNLDRRVLSSDDDVAKKNKMDVWCEVFVEELEQWIAVDVIKGKVHCPNEIYAQATHPVCYIVGWDNNNYLKDLTRRYVPHWNTVTRKQRAEPDWWKTALQPWLGPKTARDKEEDEYLDKMQLEAPLPKSIAEYKNHPLYALKRHLLKFEALYPPDARTLGFVRGEAVYDRACVHTCQSRDKWLKEAKVVKLGEQPYKIVRARPTWDKVASRISTEYKPLEIFGPWQVQDYEPPTAENGIVPRNAYGNVELFKECMLPKKTVHIKLPGLNRVAKKLNIDCAPAMTGFDFNGGWSHPIYDGFVVCEEFEEIITEAWIKDQEDQERREREKIEQRVYGNWKHLIRALMIRERLKLKYGFEEPAAQAKPKLKGPRLVVKKK